MSTERAIFAGGCFWCMVEPFEERPGILAVTSGYTGGHIEYPTYDQVLSKASGHTEAVEILFDNELISYDELLDIYWSLIDPTDADGQIYDRGANYRPVIFFFLFFLFASYALLSHNIANKLIFLLLQYYLPLCLRVLNV